VAAVRACRARAVRRTPGTGDALGTAARAPARAPRRRRVARAGDARRPSPGTGLAAGAAAGGRHPAPARRAAPDLAAAPAAAAARPWPARAGRARARRERLVGRRRRAPRLLRGGHRRGPAGLGVPPRRRRRRAADAARVVRMSDALPGYAELHCLSDFSFGRGASDAAELFERAKQQGYRALAVTDECSLAGIVRALEASEASGVPLIVGSEFSLDDGLKLVLLVEDRGGYANLCRLITRGRRRSAKGEYRLERADFHAVGLHGLLALWIPGTVPEREQGEWLKRRFDGRLWLAVELHRGPDDDARLRALQALAGELGIPAVASGDVHMHVRGRRALQDTMTAIRHRVPVARAGARLFPNGERHLRSRRALAAIHPPELLAETLRIAARCRFSLRDDLGYQYPRELVPEGHAPDTWLRHLVEQGIRERWPEGIDAGARALVEKELALIRSKGYEPYFLTVHDIVRFARSGETLRQGHGSAADLVVACVLGITAVDRAGIGLLFERLLSEERNEPPDIDVDCEHERREEVIQYIYERYGRERAAIAATV